MRGADASGRDLVITACHSVAAAEDWLAYARLAAACAIRGDAAKAAQIKAKVDAIVPEFAISRYKARRCVIHRDAVGRDREHMVAGLRKAGVPK